MMGLDIARLRLHNQHISTADFEQPVDVVRWMGAVQAQDYEGAKWAVAQRTNGLSNALLEQACTDGTILRTHVMRPTWHFVTPADIRWMLELTAPRVNALSAYYYRRLELDDAIFARSNAVVTKALQGGNQLTRAELGSVLKKAGMATHDLLRLTYMVGRAELDGLICSGAKRGKQFTYALLDERAPQAKTLARDEALAELAKRYFTSHGPATLKDYVWWSGLTTADARAGLEMIKSSLFHEDVDGKTYWFAASNPPPKSGAPAVYLLPDYDEYSVGYADRSAVFDEQHTDKLDSRGSVLAQYIIVVDGKIVGTWKRTFKKGAVVIATTLFTALTDPEEQAFVAATERYGKYLGMPVVLS